MQESTYKAGNAVLRPYLFLRSSLSSAARVESSASTNSQPISSFLYWLSGMAAPNISVRLHREANLQPSTKAESALATLQQCSKNNLVCAPVTRGRGCWRSHLAMARSSLHIHRTCLSRLVTFSSCSLWNTSCTACIGSLSFGTLMAA